MPFPCCLLVPVLSPPIGGPLIIPHPKEALWSTSSRGVGRCSIVCGNSTLDRTAAKAIAREFVYHGQAAPDIRRWPPATGSYIVIGEPDRRLWIRRLLGGDYSKVPRNEQGYFLSSRARRNVLAVVAGRSSQGTLYGAQTLCQMFFADNGRLAVR